MNLNIHLLIISIIKPTMQKHQNYTSVHKHETKHKKKPNKTYPGCCMFSSQQPTENWRLGTPQGVFDCPNTLLPSPASHLSQFATLGPPQSFAGVTRPELIVSPPPNSLQRVRKIKRHTKNRNKNLFKKKYLKAPEERSVFCLWKEDFHCTGWVQWIQPTEESFPQN